MSRPGLPRAPDLECPYWSIVTARFCVRPMRERTRIAGPSWRRGSNCWPFPLFRLVVVSFVLLACPFQPTVLARLLQQPKGNAVIIGTVVDEQHVPVVRAQVQAFS